MADILPCSIKAPHEAHPWIDVVPRKIQYHYCQGKVWNQFEVRTHLAELIQTALETFHDQSADVPLHIQVVNELWPKIVGFVQPGDMSQTFRITGDIPDDQWSYQPGVMMVAPPTPLERIADAVEKIEKNTRKIHWRNE